MMRVPMRCCVCSDKSARALTCMFWVVDVHGFNKMVTGDVHVLTDWSRVTPLFWWVACVDVNGFNKLVTGDAYVMDGWCSCVVYVVVVGDGVACVIGGW